VALLIGFVIVLVLLGLAVDLLTGFGLVGVVVAVVIAGIAAFAAWFKSDAVALRVSRARPADPEQYARLYNLVEGLCIASGLPMPRLYIIDDPAPNAFATGRNPDHAAVAVTTGLLERMNRVELEGVLAHELGHIRNYDILTMTIAVTMVGAVTILSDLALRATLWGGGRRDGDRGGLVGAVLLVVGLAFVLLAPLTARVMQYAVSRQRETLADFTAVEFTRYPPGLISALEKLKADSTVVRARSRAMAHMWIESPLDTEGESSGSRLNRLFETHPPIDERIAALREL
jgi:heat shock protein HtpX